MPALRPATVLPVRIRINRANSLLVLIWPLQPDIPAPPVPQALRAPIRALMVCSAARLSLGTHLLQALPLPAPLTALPALSRLLLVRPVHIQVRDASMYGCGPL